MSLKLSQSKGKTLQYAKAYKGGLIH